MVELAQVVEADLRLGAGQLGAHLPVGQVAQHAIAQAARRDRAQLALDRL
jgi:hypothetical protein